MQVVKPGAGNSHHEDKVGGWTINEYMEVKGTENA